MIDLAWKMLFFDKVRFLITISGVAFAVMLVLVQTGLFGGLLHNATVALSVARRAFAASASKFALSNSTTASVPRFCSSAASACCFKKNASSTLISPSRARASASAADCRRESS